MYPREIPTDIPVNGPIKEVLIRLLSTTYIEKNAFDIFCCLFNASSKSRICNEVRFNGVFEIA
jgi:hypothetical protein